MEEESSMMADSKEMQKEIINEDSGEPLIKIDKITFESALI